MAQKEKTERQLKDFGHIMALVLLIITAYLLWKEYKAWQWTFAIASIFTLSAIFIPLKLRKIEYYWMKFGSAIGVVITHIILTVLYFVVITPLGLILRLFGKKFLDLKLDPQAKTYWKPVDNKAGSSTRHFLPY